MTNLILGAVLAVILTAVAWALYQHPGTHRATRRRPPNTGSTR